MRLSKRAIKEFKEIYEKEFGEPISDKKAQEFGQNLISLFKIIYRPIPEDREFKGKKSVHNNKNP